MFIPSPNTIFENIKRLSAALIKNKFKILRNLRKMV